MALTLDYVMNKSAKKLVGLHPTVAAAAKDLIIKSFQAGVSIQIVQGFRTLEEQAALYAKGRNGNKDSIVTHALPGESYHNYGLAVDYALLLPDGKTLVWDTVRDADKDGQRDWFEVAAIGKTLGFAWGGDWSEKFKDYPHLEMTFGFNIKSLKAGKRPSEPQPEQEELALTPSNTYNKVFHERFRSVGDKLVLVPRKTDGKINYSVVGTDVRWILFKRGTIDLRFKYEKGAKVSELVKKYGAEYGFNFPFFWEGQVLGDAEDDDVVISAAYGKMLKWHELASVNGEPVIGQQDVTDQQEMLVQAGPLLIDNGNPCEDYFRILEEIPDDIGKSKAQRTFVGTRPNGDFIVAICDGRTSYDVGFTLKEERLFMAAQEASYALNGDGGGSTVLADKTGSLGQNKGAQERTVHHAVLVFPKKEEYKMSKEDADKVIELLKAVYGIVPDKEVGRLADELRKASNQPTEN